MPPPCMRCDSQRVINLETARKLGIAAGAVAGTLKGAYASLYSPGRLKPTTVFPVGRVAAAVMAGTSGGIAGAAAGHRVVLHLFPPGEGTPWLCLCCGHAFRDLS
ncbi:hypothetical protein SAMN05192555_10579 [Franzmannia pantelleriensis]|uniref:Uncharacterized protein n=1 Tax=Franzmannia pantelleriensis TaxID=48727 RepID=A0A1G9KWU8_9GAMM|nr:hypothetical protein [Halomonas pantelleriensis]SDL54109.1 hypothetical protein SAMN05192555_10579 [Halomonas pantelleriensis]